MSNHAGSMNSEPSQARNRPKMRPPRKLKFRTAAAIGAVLTVGALAPLANAQDIWTGLGDGTTWFSAGNWSTGLPNSSDDVIDVASAINFNGGGATINSFGTGVGNGGLLTLSSGTLQGASLTSAFSDASGVHISGGTLSSFVTDASTTIGVNGNGNNRLNNMTVNGVLNVTGGAFLQVDSGGLTINGTANLDSSGVLRSNANQTFGGSGQILFGAVGGAALETNSGTLTIGNGFTVDGTNGVINVNAVNNGLISSNGGGTITVTSSNITNNGTLQAINGSVLSLVSSGIGGGTLDVTNGSTIFVNASTLTGGTAQGGGVIQFSTSGNNRWNGGTLAAGTTVDLATTGGQYLQVDGGGMTIDGTVSLNNGGTLKSNANQTFDGSGVGQILFGAVNSTLDTNSGTLTIGSGLTVDGQNGTINANLVNNGVINSNAGGTINITGSNVDNTGGRLMATDGTLDLTSSTITAGLLDVTNGSTIFVNASTLTGGTAQGGGVIQFSTSGNNRWNGGTLAAGTKLDLGAIGGQFLQVDNSGMTIDGTVNLDAGGVFRSNANQVFGGSGAILFGAGAGGNGLLDTNSGTLDIGSGLTVHGENGTMVGNFTNDGLIASDGGGNIQINGSNVTNDTIMRVTAGSVLSLTSDTINNLGVLDTSNGGVILFNANNLGGGTIEGSGSVQFSGSGNNQWNGGTLAAGTTADLATQAGAFLQVNGSGMIINGTVDLDNGGQLRSNANQTYGGTGSIVFGSTGATNGGLLDTNSGTLTIGSTLTVDGKNGTIVGSFVNDGLITSDAGGTIAINSSNITNNNIIRATAGSILSLTSDTINNTGAVLDTAGGGLILFNANNLTAGTIEGSGSVQFTGDGNNQWNGGTLAAGTTADLATQSNAFLQVNGGGMTINGTVDINNGGQFRSNANQTYDGTGDIVFGATGGTLDTNSGQLTLGGGLTVHGDNGTIIVNAVNNGLVSADTFGGTITITGSTITNNGTLQAKNGGTLAIVSSFIGGGTFDAEGGSTITANANNFSGGTLQGAGSMSFSGNGNNQWNGGTVAAGGTANITNGGFLQVNGGGLTVDGTVNLDSGGLLRSNANQTFGGTGDIVFGSGGSTLATNSGQLTIGQGLTVRGDNGTINANFVNDGTISADVNGGTITVDQGFTNNATGTVQAINGGTLNVHGDITSTGTVNTSGAGEQITSLVAPKGGTIIVNGGGGTLNINGGSLVGGGTIDGNVNIGSGGTVAPGDPMIMTINGNYSQTGNFLDQIEGVTPGVNGFDQLNISGNASLEAGSTLTVDLLNGFGTHLFVGEEFNIMNYGSLTGNFSNIVSDNSGYTYSFMDNGTGKNGELIVDSVGSIVVVTGTPEPGALGLFSGLLTTGAFWYRRRRRSK